jgi:hypothetical protein
MSIRVNSVVTAADVQAWDWDTSITKVKGLYVGSWKNLSRELLEILYESKIRCNNGPGNPGNRYSWAQFCRDAFADKDGNMMVTQRTVDTWLYRHEIGEAAWKAEQATKKEAKAASGPVAFDNDSMFIEKRIKNKDGSYTLRFSFSEYEDTLFEETVTV